MKKSKEKENKEKLNKRQNSFFLNQKSGEMKKN